MLFQYFSENTELSTTEYASSAVMSFFVNSHCLCQVNQEQKKVTVVMICRGQKGNKGKAMTCFGINGSQSMQAVTNHVYRF